MATLSNGGFFNPAYHDSETLELDKRFSSRTHHANPYAREDPTWRGERASSERGVGTGHWVGWQEDANRDTIAMDVVSTGPRSPAWQRDLNQTTFQTSPESHYDPSHSVRFPSAVSGNMTMRWRGMAMRRMSMFGHSDPALAFTEDALMHEMENEEQNLVKELVAMSTRERIQAIRDLPLSCEDKKQIRNQVLAFKSSKQSHGLTCLTDCSEDVSLFFRRFGYAVCSARQTLELWQGTMKEIGGRFGTSVLSYFVFLKWLLMFNIFSFLVNFGFITIPLLVYEPSPSTPENVTFRGLEILTGAGYFNSTVMYYGGYSNETITHLVDYNMQLAYFFTIAVYMVLCGLALLISMASSFRRNYVLSDASSCSAWQLLCSWDFSVTNEKAVRRGKNNLRVQLKESLSEKAQGERLTFSEKMKRFGVHVLCWFLSTGLTIGCGAAIYYLCQFEQQRATDATSWTPLQEAETLLVPFVVSLINLVVPLFYSLVNKFENYSSQRSQIYALVLRNVLLKMSILAVLCYYWMNVVAVKFPCWESMVGQALYRLVIFDFLFLMLGSFFGEFLSNVIGTRVLPRLGVPEFDVARNVLELIYAQTLAWIGIYFAPLLPVIQIAKFFILFYLKKVSLTQNCQPPRRSGRAAQMQTIFIAILFFPSFVGGLSVVAYTAWSLTPSEYCGPFRGLNSTFSVVNVWIEDLQDITGSEWVIWIYQHVIRSELFFFLITLIILVIIYIFWQITRGRKQLIGRLRQYIVNEGKDKSFLLEKLQNLQKSGPQKKRKPKNQNKLANQHFGDHSSSSQSSSDAMAQILLARRQFELEEESEGSGGLPVPSDLTTSSPSTALMQAMLARHRAEEQDSDYYQLPGEHSASSGALAQAMQARQRAENQDGDYHLPDEHSASSGALAQAMQARQRAEEGDRIQVFAPPTQEPAPPGSSALIQAMLARQQAQNEYDDGY